MLEERTEVTATPTEYENAPIPYLRSKTFLESAEFRLIHW